MVYSQTLLSTPELVGTENIFVPVQVEEETGCTHEIQESYNPEGLPFTKAQILQFINGIFIGALQQNHLTQMQKCIGNIPFVAHELLAALQDFKEKDLTHIADALVHIGNILIKLPSILLNCSGAKLKSDIARILAWAAPFKNPKEEMPKILENIKEHLFEMVHELDGLNQAILAKDISKAGQQAAKILSYALGPINMAELLDMEIKALEAGEITQAVDPDTISYTQW